MLSTENLHLLLLTLCAGCCHYSYKCVIYTFLEKLVQANEGIASLVDVTVNMACSNTVIVHYGTLGVHQHVDFHFFCSSFLLNGIHSFANHAQNSV